MKSAVWLANIASPIIFNQWLAWCNDQQWILKQILILLNLFIIHLLSMTSKISCIYENMKLFWKYFGSIFNIAPYMYCLKQMVQIYEHYNLTDSHLCLAYDIVNALVEHNRNIIPPFLIFHHINTNFKTSFQTYISPTNVIHIWSFLLLLLSFI